MELGYFTYVAGLASILGFMAQVLDWFPQHKNVRKSALLVFVGIFFGSLANAFSASKIEFKFEVTGFTLLISVIGLVVIILLFIGVFTREYHKRSELLGASAIGTVVFLFVLLYGGLPTIDNEASRIRNEKSRLTVTELLTLADTAANSENFDRAIMHLKLVKLRVGSDDPRTQRIDEKINEIKRRQVE